MAETWASNRRGRPLRGDRHTKVDALAARRVLRDGYRARHALAKALQSEPDAELRLRWVTVVALLRSVGHALNSVDARRSLALKQAGKAAWVRWRDASFHHLNFHEFIKRERDILLKEYRFTTGRLTPGNEAAATETIGPATRLLIGDRSYSLLEAVDAALAWWETEIAKIEDEAGALLQHST